MLNPLTVSCIKATQPLNLAGLFSFSRKLEDFLLQSAECGL
jgi:hypothetical protein